MGADIVPVTALVKRIGAEQEAAAVRAKAVAPIVILAAVVAKVITGVATSAPLQVGDVDPTTTVDRPLGAAAVLDPKVGTCHLARKRPTKVVLAAVVELIKVDRVAAAALAPKVVPR